MISALEIKSKARELGVPVSTIERDYAQNWLLKHLSAINMSMKGGTGIRKLFIMNYRFSDDLDFTLLDNLTKSGLQKAIKEASHNAREDSGIEFIDEIKMNRNDNGFAIHTYFRLLRTSGDPIRIKLDITETDREILVLPSIKKPIIHPFSDICPAKVNAYPLREIAAEKVRALFERTRPRDIYDVWYLHKHVYITKIKEILRKKCSFKNINIRSSEITKKKGKYSSAWRSSLQHQLRDLPDFNDVFNETIGIIKKYETD